jgi:predicted DCC family thiol-disulfide oxidoreductase YuxK
MNKQANDIILFDGICNFCNFWVNRLMKFDKKFIFKFAALQSTVGKELLQQHLQNEIDLDSFILISDNKLSKKSTAALLIARKLGGAFILFYPLIFLPLSFRDFVYDIIASNRYKLFGKKDSCRIPSAKDRERFLN